MTSAIRSSSAQSKSVLEAEARTKAKFAVALLTNDSELPCLVFERAVSDRSTPYPFPTEDVYQAVASAAGFKVVRSVRQSRQGYEHLLTLTRDPALTPELESLRSRASLQ